MAPQFGERPWYRHVCAIGAVFNMFMMTIANLIGFVIGTDGIQYMLHQLFSTWEGKLISVSHHFVVSSILLTPFSVVSGIQFLLLACGCMFVASQVMFEYRCVILLMLSSMNSQLSTFLVRRRKGGEFSGVVDIPFQARLLTMFRSDA